MQLICADGVLASARSRLLQATEQLEGPAGYGEYRRLRAQLIARRNRLVADLGRVFEIGPILTSHLDASPLDEQLEAFFGGTMAAAQTLRPATPPLASPSKPLSPASPHQQRLQPPPSSLAPPDALQRSSIGSVGSVGALTAAGSELCGVSDGSGGRPAAPPARLSIAGLELAPDLAKRGLEGAVGRNGHFDEDQRAAAALGYVCQVLDLLSRYLDVPLRYPVKPGASTSAICDFAPALSSYQLQQGGYGARAAAAAAAAAAAQEASTQVRAAVLRPARGARVP